MDDLEKYYIENEIDRIREKSTSVFRAYMALGSVSCVAYLCLINKYINERNNYMVLPAILLFMASYIIANKKTKKYQNKIDELNKKLIIK